MNDDVMKFWESHRAFTLDVSGENWGWKDDSDGIHMISPSGEDHVVPKKEYISYDKAKGYPDDQYLPEDSHCVRPLTIAMYIEENFKSTRGSVG